MGLLRSLAMLSFMTWFFWLSFAGSQLSGSARNSARALDGLLQDYAYRAFVRPRTGIPYDGIVPSNLTGIKIAAMRLRSGSLRTRGVEMYKEFHIPTGVIEQPYVKRLVLVYQNLGNWSAIYYPLSGYSYLTPVVGLLAYDAFNLSATNLPELDIHATGDPLLIKFSDLKPVPGGSIPKCVTFSLQGLVNFSNVIAGNVCSIVQHGHFSIIVESTTAAPAPAPVAAAPGYGAAPHVGPLPSSKGKKSNSKMWIIIGSVAGGVVLLFLLGLLLMWVRKCKRKKRMQQMERSADVGEALGVTTVGNTRAPAAMVMRTQPVLESEYVP